MALEYKSFDINKLVQQADEILEKEKKQSQQKRKMKLNIFT